jgi:hypothetical protein
MNKSKDAPGQSVAADFEPRAFDMAAITPFYAAQVADESTLPNAALGLPQNITFTRRTTKRTMAELVRTRHASQTIGRLPAPGETLHAVLKGGFSLFDFLPAILDLADDAIDRLHIVTLSMAHRNVDRLDQWATEGRVKDVRIIVSCYHAAADKAIYDHATAFCAKHGFRILPLRSHAKMLALKIGERHMIVESSANLRSCRNIENAIVYDDADLYRWHTGWINELFAQGAQQ